LFLLTLIFGVFLFIFYLFSFSSPEEYLHYYGVPETSLRDIDLKVLYFVPSDREISVGWQSAVQNALEDIQTFHFKEFHNTGIIRYDIYPEPIIGIKGIHFYDGEDTSRGNPDALNTILKEVNDRVFDEKGDLYRESFVKQKNKSFTIKIFVYEGVGAAGGHLAVIIAKDYFTLTQYGSSTLYHEILHTFGVPDSYDYETGVGPVSKVFPASVSRIHRDNTDHPGAVRDGHIEGPCRIGNA